MYEGKQFFVLLRVHFAYILTAVIIMTITMKKKRRCVFDRFEGANPHFLWWFETPWKKKGSCITDSYGSTMINERRHCIYEHSVLDLPIYRPLFSSQCETGWSFKQHISGLKQQSNQAWFLGLPATLNLLRRYNGKMGKCFKEKANYFLQRTIDTQSAL